MRGRAVAHQGRVCSVGGRTSGRRGGRRSLRQALDWARRQGALSWRSLRAATSLARLWRDQNRTKAAREILAPVYDRFTEGFETTDLKAAKLLLDDLRASRRLEVGVATLAISLCSGFASVAGVLGAFWSLVARTMALLQGMVSGPITLMEDLRLRNSARAVWTNGGCG